MTSDFATVYSRREISPPLRKTSSVQEVPGIRCRPRPKGRCETVHRQHPALTAVARTGCQPEPIHLPRRYRICVEQRRRAEIPGPALRARISARKLLMLASTSASVLAERTRSNCRPARPSFPRRKNAWPSSGRARELGMLSQDRPGRSLLGVWKGL